MAPKGVAGAREVLRANREQAYAFAKRAGEADTRKVLERAERDLRRRLREAEGLGGPGAESFTAAQMRATLAQVEAVSRDLAAGVGRTAYVHATKAAETGAENVVDYLEKADAAFRGIGTQPLALPEAAIVNKAVSGAQSTVLRRLMSGFDNAGNPLRGGKGMMQRAGVLARYGEAVVSAFEKELQTAFVARKSFDEVKASLIERSPFLAGMPRHWAERVVRTEVMGASNRAAWEATRAADDELGDLCKILSATFDNRTGADSYAVHGQIRRVDEPFEWWGGLFQHPPARPNDREVVVPHRIVWEIPSYLAWKSDGEVSARWRFEGRKGGPPGRPKMTTIDLVLFGKPQEKKREEPASPRSAPRTSEPEEKAPSVEQKPAPSAIDTRGYPVAGSAYGKTADSFLTHAVDWEKQKVLCGGAKFSNILEDETQADPSPSCPRCVAKLQRLQRA